MTLELTNGTGAQTLDIKQPEWADEGYGVAGDVSTPGSGPLAVTINTGALGAGNAALSVASGDVLVGGATVSYGGGTVDIATGGAMPRKDLLWIDSNGDIQVEQGTPTAPKPQGADRFGTFVPAVPFPPTTPAVCLGAVYVAANATAISAQDLQDRRVTSETVRSTIITEKANIGKGDVRGGVSTTLSSVGSAETVAQISANNDTEYLATGYVSVIAHNDGERTASIWSFAASPGGDPETELQSSSGGGGGDILADIVFNSPYFDIDITAVIGSGWSSAPTVVVSVDAFGMALDLNAA